MNEAQWYWEALTIASLSEVFALIATVESADHAPIRTAHKEVESYFGEALPWKAQGARSIGTGELIAFGFVRAENLIDASAITISGGVHPAWQRQGIGAELLERQIDLAQLLGAELGFSDYKIKMYIDERQHNLADLADKAAFVHEYSFIQAQKVLTAKVQAHELGQYLEIAPMTPRHYAALAKSEIPPAQYQILQNNSELTELDLSQYGYNPKWCFVALYHFADRPEIAGYLLCSHFDFNTGNAVDTEAYLEELAVFPKWAGKEIEAALVTQALAQFWNDGMRLAGVDLIQKPDGAEEAINHILRELGFQETAKTLVVSTQITS